MTVSSSKSSCHPSGASIFGYAAPSSQTRRFARRNLEHFIGRSSPVHVIPNGVHLDKPSRSRSDVLREFGIPGNTQAIILGQIAGLVPFKGQVVLLDAARRILDKAATFTFSASATLASVLPIRSSCGGKRKSSEFRIGFASRPIREISPMSGA